MTRKGGSPPSNVAHSARRRREEKPKERLTNEQQQELVSLQNSLGLPDGRMSANDETARLARAIHEAGHAVIGHVLGRTLRAVSVVEHCEFEPVTQPSVLDEEISIKVALAGPHAEVLLSGSGECIGAGSDLVRARDGAKRIASDSWEESLQALSNATGTLVTNHAEDILKVAALLVKDGGVLRAPELLAALDR